MNDLLKQIPALLAACEPTLRQEAEQLVEADSVRGLDLSTDEILAEVRLDDRSVNTRWALEEEGWIGESDVEDRVLHNLALAAVLIALQRKAQREPEAIAAAQAEPPFASWVEGQLGRPLKADEDLYLDKIAKRFERAKHTGQIFDHDMVRLHPKWSIQSVEPLQLWPQPPRSLREFWQYVALALQQRGLVPPLFLKQITDLSALRQRLRHWQTESGVPLWRERINRLLEARPNPLAIADLRLVLSPNEARLQASPNTEGEFSPLSRNHFEALLKAHAEAAISLPAEAELLMLSVARVMQGRAQGIESCRVDLDEHPRWLSGLFAQPLLASRLLNLDSHSFAQGPDLIWTTKEDGTKQELQFLLIPRQGGEAPTLPLRVLHGSPTRYLSAEQVHQGPTWLPHETRMEQWPSIPLAALAHQSGIEFLQTIGLELPPSLAKRVKKERLHVQIEAQCARKAPGSNLEYASFKAVAVNEEGQVRERLGPQGWASILPSEDDLPQTELILCSDRSALEQAAARIRELGATWDIESQGMRVRLTKNFPDAFNTWAVELPEGISLKADERLQTILADPLIARVRLEATQTATIDWFDLRLIFEIEGADLKLADIRRLVAAKGGFVQLADGTWRRARLELSEDQQALMDQLGLDLDQSPNETHTLNWRQLDARQASEIIPAKAWEKITQRMEQAKLEERPEPPSGITLTLRPYQIEGYHFLAYLSVNRFGGILADDMGLGKTLQSIAWILWLRGRYRNPWPCLVVCPKSVLDVWAQELAKAAPDLKVQILHERDALDITQLKSPAPNQGPAVQVLVMNYAQMRSSIEELQTIQWLAVILDEAQQIKNPDSQAARAARSLKAENRLALTGTPLENRLLDLWSLMTFAMPGSLGDRAYFTRQFDRRKDGRAAERLSARLRPFLLRRTKAQVARDLPPRTEEAILCEMTPEQSELYRQELARAQHLLLSSNAIEVLSTRRFAVLQALTRLRQICCQPQLALPEQTDTDSAKLTATLELIEELHESGHKVLLFSQFVSMLTVLRDRLQAMNIPHHWLTGATQNRAEVVRNFQTDPNPCVFLLSLKAGGSGLNLTAASYVILYDPWWNPAVEAQAIDRAHRIGQTQPVMAYRMITKGSIEEKIMLLQQKKQLMSQTLLGEGSFARTLEKNDFEFLFDIEASEQAREAQEKH